MASGYFFLILCKHTDTNAKKTFFFKNTLTLTFDHDPDSDSDLDQALIWLFYICLFMYFIFTPTFYYVSMFLLWLGEKKSNVSFTPFRGEKLHRDRFHWGITVKTNHRLSQWSCDRKPVLLVANHFQNKPVAPQKKAHFHHKACTVCVSLA